MSCICVFLLHFLLFPIFVADDFFLWRVVEQVGLSLLVLAGPAKGLEGELLRIHEDKFNCDVRITQRGSALTGEELCGLEYDHVCKYSP